MTNNVAEMLQSLINWHFKLVPFPTCYFESIFCHAPPYNLQECSICWCLDRAAHVTKWLRFHSVSCLPSLPTVGPPLPAHRAYIQPESGSHSQSCCGSTSPFVASGPDFRYDTAAYHWLGWCFLIDDCTIDPTGELHRSALLRQPECYCLDKEATSSILISTQVCLSNFRKNGVDINCS